VYILVAEVEHGFGQFQELVVGYIVVVAFLGKYNNYHDSVFDNDNEW